MSLLATPFRHAVIDNYITPDDVRRINADWPTAWTDEQGTFQRKMSTENVPNIVQELIDHVDVRIVEHVTGIKGLFKDPDNAGGGCHCIPRGGFLKMHVDFNLHPEREWARRANMLIYLNEDWQSEWGGQLVLKNGDSEARVDPIAGRCVIFETNEKSWHGHPAPLRCPSSRQRRSVAIYFYSDDSVPAVRHSTIYKK